MGWFACLVPISKVGAQEARDPDGYREFYYPAVFVKELKGEAAKIACAHIAEMLTTVVASPFTYPQLAATDKVRAPALMMALKCTCNSVRHYIRNCA